MSSCSCPPLGKAWKALALYLMSFNNKQAPPPLPTVAHLVSLQCSRDSSADVMAPVITSQRAEVPRLCYLVVYRKPLSSALQPGNSLGIHSKALLSAEVFKAQDGGLSLAS